MRILKVLYVCWIIFWGLACILGSVMGEWGYREVNEIFNTMLFLYFLLCLFPLLPYFYYLIYEKTKSKNIFVAVYYYLLLFVAIWLKENNNNASFYSIGIIIHIVTFVMIYKSKRSSNEASNQQP